MSERDKFLTSVIDDCEHQGSAIAGCCLKCGENSGNYDFSLWDNFGNLWEFISTHPARWEMAGALKCGRSSINGGKFIYLPEELIHPDRLADAVYEFLKERNG